MCNKIQMTYQKYENKFDVVLVNVQDILNCNYP